jgi:hypothetical protein
MKKIDVRSLFYQAVSILLIGGAFSVLGERQPISQVRCAGLGSDYSSPQNKRDALTPSEIAKRYWKASADGKFSETRRYIDFCSLNHKYSVDRGIINTLARLIPRAIYEGPEAPGGDSVELIAEKITEAKIDQAINEITLDDHTYLPTPEMRKSLSAYYATEYQSKFQELSEQYIASNDDNGTPPGATGGNVRRRSAADRYRAAMRLRVQFIADFARSELTVKGLEGVFTVVKGPHGHSRERLSMEYAAKILDHVQVRAELHATSTFLAATPKRSRPGNASSSPQNMKPGELVIGRIEEESLKGDAASIVAIIHFREYPVTRSHFTLRRCKGEWKIDSVNLFYKDVFDLRKDLKKKENKDEIRKIASLPPEHHPVFRIPAAIPLIVKSVA